MKLMMASARGGGSRRLTWQVGNLAILSSTMRRIGRPSPAPDILLDITVTLKAKGEAYRRSFKALAVGKRYAKDG